MTDIISKTKKYFATYIRENDDIYLLKSHVPLVEKWVNRLCDKHPEADREVVILGVYLHDIAHYPLIKGSDHAVRGEEKAIKFLKENGLSEEKVKEVAHLVRSHRCNDIEPQTIEAKILACADSASHFDDTTYLDIIQQGRVEYGAGKLDRDFRDIGIFPEVQQELKPLYEAWKMLYKAYMNLNKKL